MGDVPNLPGAMSLAALGAATTGVNYIKAGLYGLKTKEEAVYLMQSVTRAVKDIAVMPVKAVISWQNGYINSRYFLPAVSGISF